MAIFKSQDREFQSNALTRKNKTLDERFMKLPQRLNNKQKRAIRARFDEIYDDEWGAGQWLSHYEMKGFSIDESAMQ